MHRTAKCDADAHREVDYTYEIVCDIQNRISFLVLKLVQDSLKCPVRVLMMHARD